MGVPVVVAVFLGLPRMRPREIPYEWSTLTGRTEIWEFTIDVWRPSPLFGVGPEFLQGESELEFYSWYGWMPRHAHNQLFQALGETGIIGLGLMGAYLIALALNIRSSDGAGKRVAWFLLSFVIVKGLTEVPLIAQPLSVGFFYQFSLFGVVILLAKGCLLQRPAKGPAPLLAPASGLRADHRIGKEVTP
jgi:O-antigen ligase